MNTKCINVINMSKVVRSNEYAKLFYSDQLTLQHGNSFWTDETVEWLRNNNVTIHSIPKPNHLIKDIVFEFETEEEATMFVLKFV